jgi:hypothetical protein
MANKLYNFLFMFAAFLFTIATSATADEEVSVPQEQDAATHFEAHWQRQNMVSAAITLLRHDSTNSTAWVVVSRTRRAGGDLKGALVAARHANAHADTEEELFAAALELAVGNVLLERGIYAQFWLRRAVQVSPTAALRNGAIQNFRAVRANAPWQFTLSSSAIPSSNVNNGSRNETLELFGLPFILSGDALALSGVEFNFSSTARHQFSGFANQPAVLSFSSGNNRVALSDEAKKQAPEASGSDYSFDAFEVGFSQIVSSWDQASLLQLNTLFGHNRYGGEALTNYARAGILVQWPVGAQSLIAVAGSVERQNRFDDDRRSAWLTNGNLKQTWQVGTRGDILGLTFGLQNTSSESIEVDNRAALLSLNYRTDKPVIGPFTLSGSINAERRIYDSSSYSVDGRQDTRGSLSLTLGMPEWNYYGFAPALTFEASQTSSNINIYDTQDLGIRISIESAF